MEFGETTTTKVKNPTDIFLTFGGASDDGTFKYYDPELREKVVYDLVGKEFVVARTGNSITGFSKQYNNRLFSNEIQRGDQELEICVWDKPNNKKVVLKKGKWKDIKVEAEALGAKFQTVVTGIIDGKVVGISLTGSGLGEWSNFIKTIKITHDKVVLDKVETRKNGAIKYSVPLFKKGGPVSAEDYDAAHKAHLLLKAYYSNDPVLEETEIDVTKDEIFG